MLATLKIITMLANASNRLVKGSCCEFVFKSDNNKLICVEQKESSN